MGSCARDEAEGALESSPARDRVGIFGGAEIVRGGRTLRFEGDESEMDGGWLGAETKGESGGGVGIWWRLDRLGLDCYIHRVDQRGYSVPLIGIGRSRNK